MRRLVIAVGLSAGILLVAGRAEAQYRYTDDKGVSKVTQYKLDVPAPYRDSAVWIGKTGVGKPGLSEGQRQWKERGDAYHRIGEETERLVPHKKPEGEATKGAAAAAQGRQDAADAPGLDRQRVHKGR